MNRLKCAFSTVMSLMALVLVLLTLQQSTWAAIPQFPQGTVKSFAPLPEIPPAVTLQQQVAPILEQPVEPITRVRAQRPTRLTLAAQADYVELFGSEPPVLDFGSELSSSEKTEGMDTEYWESESITDSEPQAVSSQEDPEVTRARIALQEAQKRAAEKLKAAQEAQGKKIQESMTPKPPAQAQPLQPPQSAQSQLPGSHTQTFDVKAPAMCNDTGRVLAAIDKVKAEKSVLGTAEVSKFFADINAAKGCEDFKQRLSKYVDMAAVTPYPVQVGPNTKEIITNPKDARLADYLIGPYGDRFVHWNEQRVAKEELRTLEDYIRNEEVLIDHIKNFQIPENRRDLQHLMGKMAQMREEMPEMLRGCLDQPWRFAPGVGLCQWMDASEVPIWVTTWAGKTRWGVFYDLEVKRSAPVLVVWLPKSQEYVFWAGPCGGNGGWLPSAQPFTFQSTTNRVNIDCEKVEAPGAKFDSQGRIVLPKGGQRLMVTELSNPREAELQRYIEEQKKQGVEPESYLRLTDWVWSRNGQVISGIKKGATSIIADQPGTYSVINSAIDAIASGQPVKACKADLVTSQVHALCETLGQTSIQGDRVIVPFRFVENGIEKTQPSQDGFVKKLLVLLDGKEVPSDQVRLGDKELSIPAALVTSGTFNISVQLIGENQEVLGQCPGGATITVPTAECDQKSFALRTEKDRVAASLSIPELAVKLTSRVEIRVDDGVLDPSQYKLAKDYSSFSFKNNIAGFGTHVVEILGYDEKGNVIWKCGGGNNATFDLPAPCPKCTSASSDPRKMGKKDVDQTITIIPQFEGDVNQIDSFEWTDQTGKVVGTEMQLSGSAGDLLPTKTDKKGNQELKDGSTTFTLKARCKNGTIVSCKATITVKGRSLWPWLLLAAIIIAVVVVVILTSGGAAPVITKIPIVVVGV